MKRIQLPCTLFLIALSLWSCGNENPKKAGDSAVRPPNIIYIMADDLGYGDIGAFGQSVIQTPNINRLSEEGMMFTDHYAGTSVCAPSRCVLMTGIDMGRAAIRGNMQWEPHGQMPLPDSSITVAEALKGAGYVTGMFGKWGLGITGTEGDPNQQGWDEFYGYTDQVLAHNYWPEYLVRNGEKVHLNNAVKYLDSTAWHGGYGSYSIGKKEYSNDLFTERALAFIQEHQDSSFLLYLPYTIPHDNGEAPVGERQEVPQLGRFQEMDWPAERKGYAAMIERLDGYVGQITHLVDSLGLGKNTLIVFTSDNGPMQETRSFTAFFDSNGPYRGGKRDVYEGGIRMPFVARWTGTIAPGTTTAFPSAFHDFLPTACAIAGVEPPEQITGQSYLPTLLGQEQMPPEYLYFAFYEQGKKQAVRKGKWKALRNGVFEQPDIPWELYDLNEDPGETQNLAGQHPEVVLELAQLAARAHHTDPNWPLFKTEAVE
ncbi:MAG: arylsulfatase [Phaeodactylibacter sp.]|uniref:arylsulfatase n=1 Tax=Phaeodactylibacter sp. TaxID=1940289 RepID=UPI0032EECA3B